MQSPGQWDEPCEDVRREALLLLGCQPVPRPRLRAVVLAHDRDLDLMPATFLFVARVVADQVLAVQFLADTLDCVFQPVLPVKAVLRSTSRLREKLSGARLENIIDVLV